MPSLSAKRILPHTFRHMTAVHLIASCVDVTVIRSWLSHAQFDTTNRYAQANLQTVAPQARPSKPARWKRAQDLLAWLDSLRGSVIVIAEQVAGPAALNRSKGKNVRLDLAISNEVKGSSDEVARREAAHHRMSTRRKRGLSRRSPLSANAHSASPATADLAS